MRYFPAQQLLSYEFVKETAAVGIAGGDFGLTDKNGIVVEGVDYFYVDYERLRDSCENGPGELVPHSYNNPTVGYNSQEYYRYRRYFRGEMGEAHSNSFL